MNAGIAAASTWLAQQIQRVVNTQDQLMQLCEERTSPPLDGLSCLDENGVIACWHRGNLGFSRPGFCDCRFRQGTDTVENLPGIEAAVAGKPLPVPSLEVVSASLASKAIADPSHERHRELKEWFADDFNPHVVDIDWLSEDVADLAQRWSRQPAVKRRRTA